MLSLRTEEGVSVGNEMYFLSLYKICTVLVFNILLTQLIVS